MSTVVELSAAKQLLAAQRTKAEDLLEAHFRLRHLPQWRREYPFAQSVKRKFRADFAFVSDRLLVEVQGGSWTGGRHTRGTGYERDCEKLNTAAVLGWQVLWVTPAQIRSGMALKWVEDILLVRSA